MTSLGFMYLFTHTLKELESLRALITFEETLQYFVSVLARAWNSARDR